MVIFNQVRIMKKFYEFFPEMEVPFYNRPRGIRLEAHIADIHFGAIDPEKQYQILMEQFVNKISYLQLDLISINGDLFDHKFMSNSDTVMYAMSFVSALVDYCKRTGCTLILLHGTMSHDANQLKLFYSYLNDPLIDIRIVEEVEFQFVKGKKILCVPELYGRSADYYTNYLYNSSYYDSAIIHGTFVGSIFGKDQAILGSDREPVFSIDNFCNCMGPIIAGHVHVPQCFKEHFYYCGSPIRYKFGEEQPKGFYILMHDLDSRQYYIHFEEIKSFRYDTINLDYMLNQDPKNIIDYINNLRKNGIDYVRVEFTQANQNINIVREYYRTNNNVFIKDELKESQIAAKDKAMAERVAQYSYILDKNLSEYEILTRYINQNMGCSYITVDELKELLLPL